MTAAGQPQTWLMWAAPGVGSTPASSTSAPSEASPAARAASSIGPDRRVSRARRKGDPVPNTRAAARPRASANSGVSSTLASPRTPSVPKRRVTPGLPLGVLGRLPGLLQAVFLALLLPGVPREQPRLLHLGAQVGVERDQRPGDPEAHGAGLAAHPAAGQRAVHVVDLGCLREAQRFGDDHPVGGVGEEGLEGPAVAADDARARAQPYPGDRFLAPSGGLD